MEKTIEQQIAEGIAQGIQKAKEQEVELKRKKAQDYGAGYIVFFLSWILTLFTYVAIKQMFGLSKEFLHNFSYPIIVIIEIGFTVWLLKEDFKTHFISTLFFVLFNAFFFGYLLS